MKTVSLARTAEKRRKRRQINRSLLVNPVVIYSAVWLTALALIHARWAAFMTPVRPRFVLLVGGNIAISAAAYFIARWVAGLRLPRRVRIRGRVMRPAAQVKPEELDALRRFSRLLFVVWGGGSVINAFASGGLPIIWLLRGIPRSYAEYGIPTFSGMVAACGVFSNLGFFLVFMMTRRKRYLLPIVCLVAYQFAILSRGGTFLLLLEIVAVYLQIGRIGLRRLMAGGMILLVLIGFFGVMGDVRAGGHGEELREALATPEGKQVFERLPSGFWWTYLYASVGAVNLNAALDEYEPLGHPYWSVISLFPTVVRGVIYTETTYELRYPLPMVSAAFNVFTMYGSYLADFGLKGCFAITFLLQLLAGYYFVRGRSGSVAAIVGYAVCFQIIALSLFTDNLTSWVTLFQLVLTVALRLFMRSSGRETYETRRRRVRSSPDSPPPAVLATVQPGHP